jgi:hypothetical protein
MSKYTIGLGPAATDKLDVREKARVVVTVEPIMLRATVKAEAERMNMEEANMMKTNAEVDVVVVVGAAFMEDEKGQTRKGLTRRTVQERTDRSMLRLQSTILTVSFVVQTKLLLDANG